MREDFLTQIIECKRQRLGAARAVRPLEAVQAVAHTTRRQSLSAHALRRALQQPERINVIAEIKRASPSKGMICERVVPAEMAQAYQAGGAAAISVLTEEDHFRGSLDDLASVRTAITLPVLRKDFIFDEYQIYEAAAAGADALLLIVAALDVPRLATLRRIAEDELGMDALVEVHTADEMHQACECGATLIGVNNRDLRTFAVSLDVSVRLAAQAPRDVLLISESGLSTGSDLRHLHELGFHGFLIGEMLMRAAEPDKTLRQLLKDATGVGDAGKVSKANTVRGDGREAKMNKREGERYSAN